MPEIHGPRRCRSPEIRSRTQSPLNGAETASIKAFLPQHYYYYNTIIVVSIELS